MTPWIIKQSGLALTLGVRAITLYPLIFCSESAPAALLLGHEDFHVDQVEEKIDQYGKTGWFIYYWDYVGQYVRLRRAGLKHRKAYHGITYEIEAHRGQRERAKDLPMYAVKFLERHSWI